MAPKQVVQAQSEEPIVEPVVASTTVASVPQAVDTVPDVITDTEVTEKDKFVDILEVLHLFQNNVKDLISTVKTLQKEHVKLVKQKSKKTSKKILDESGEVKKRQPSGFAKPTRLSNELCDFLKISHDTMMARTEVTRRLNDYIKAHNLQDKDDRRRILPDAALESILTLQPGIPLSYFSLQSSIKSHFQKA